MTELGFYTFGPDMCCIRIRIRIFIIPINGPTIGAHKLHTLNNVIGGNNTYIYKKYI
jgi:hypothetical protein